jgi:2-polyprenyl-3-methyl-5-hydroxy-6-metoxy-1,4-benzoquinol methylase
MKDMNNTNFDEKAATWDEDPFKIKLAHDVADAIIKEIQPRDDMNVLDYGCGSGLITLKLQPLVKSITGMDSSRGMIEVLQNKVKTNRLQNVHARLMDLEQAAEVDDKFHLIVSSMALHHIHEPSALVKRLYDLLVPEGYLAIADLDKENGSFHKDGAGVFHSGFERAYLRGLYENAGLPEIRDITAATVTRNSEGKGRREFTVFLIIGKK